MTTICSLTNIQNGPSVVKMSGMVVATGAEVFQITKCPGTDNVFAYHLIKTPDVMSELPGGQVIGLLLPLS